jgi:glycosyltransferase involved in cell wall biosynthesis
MAPTRPSPGRRHGEALPLPGWGSVAAVAAIAPAPTPPSLRLAVIVCAHNEAAFIGPCVHSLLAQTRVPDAVVVVDNASSDATAAIAAAVPGVRVVSEPVKGLVRARERGRLATDADLLLFLDADCRAPLQWVEHVERRFLARPDLLALSGAYRFYDWHRFGRLLIRGYDVTVGPSTHLLVKHVLNAGVVFYGGNFAVRASALDAIGGFDISIEFHGEDTNLGRRLHAQGRVELRGDCYVHTSARRYRAMGTWAVIGLYVRNFWSEILRHRPSDRAHIDVR